MPRDSSGNWVLYAGNPVTTGTTIASAWWNGTYNDLGSSIADSLDRTGATGGMTGQLKLYTAGSGPSLPAATFDSEPTTGLYWNGTGDMRVAVQGVIYSKWTSAGFQESFDGGTTWKNPLYNNNGNQTFTGGLDFTAGSLTLGGTSIVIPTRHATGSSGNWTTTNTSYARVGTSPLALSFTATGRPVNVFLMQDGTSNVAQMSIYNTTSAAQNLLTIALSTDSGSTFFGEQVLGYDGLTSGTVNGLISPVSIYSYWFEPPAGACVIWPYAKVAGTGSPQGAIRYAALCVMQY